MNQIGYIHINFKRRMKKTAKAARNAGLIMSTGFPGSVFKHVPGIKPQGVLVC